MTLVTRGKVMAALAISLGIHAGIFAGFGSFDEDTQVAGGAPVELAALGNSFEDMVAAGGRLQPVDGADETEPVPVETAKPVEADKPVKPVPVERAEQSETAKAEPPETTNTEPVTAIEAAETVKTPQTELPDAAPVLEAQTAGTAKPVELASLPPADAVPVPEPSPRARAESRQAEKPEKTAPKPPETIKAKPEQVERRQERKPTPKRVVTQGTGEGNAARDAIRGSAAGRQDVRKGSTSQGAGRVASVPGNAAVSNYPGKVQSKIHRTRQRRSSGRGKVLVRFSVTRNGGLGSVAVARGSGVQSVDSMAIDHIRRAAPFPPPPPGAKTRFTMWVQIGR